MLKNSIFYNNRRNLGQKKLETFCGRRWVRAGSHCSRERKSGKGHYQFKSDGYILTVFFKTMNSKPNYSDQNWSPKC